MRVRPIQLLLGGMILVCLPVKNGTGAVTENDPTLYRQQGGYVRGAKQIEILLRETREPEKRLPLLFELAACYHFDPRGTERDKALETYRSIIEEFPEHPLVARAYFYLGRCLDLLATDHEKDLVDARRAYREVYERFPYSLWADQSFFWHAYSFLFNLTPDSALEGAKQLSIFLERFPDSILRGVVHAQLSELHTAWLANYEKGAIHAEAALAYIHDAELRSSLLYRLGYLSQFNLNDPDGAIQWYTQLMAESPVRSDPNYFVAEKRIAELSGRSED